MNLEKSWISELQAKRVIRGVYKPEVVIDADDKTRSSRLIFFSWWDSKEGSLLSRSGCLREGRCYAEGLSTREGFRVAYGGLTSRGRRGP